jgi:hypothetical protein
MKNIFNQLQSESFNEFIFDKQVNEIFIRFYEDKEHRKIFFERLNIERFSLESPKLTTIIPFIDSLYFYTCYRFFVWDGFLIGKKGSIVCAWQAFLTSFLLDREAEIKIPDELSLSLIDLSMLFLAYQSKNKSDITFKQYEDFIREIEKYEETILGNDTKRRELKEKYENLERENTNMYNKIISLRGESEDLYHKLKLIRSWLSISVTAFIIIIILGIFYAYH